MSLELCLREPTGLNPLISSSTNKLLLHLTLLQTIVQQKHKINKNGRAIPSDVSYTEKLKLEIVYNDGALYSNNTYKMDMTVRTEQTIMYPVVPLIDAEAPPNLVSSAFIKPQ